MVGMRMRTALALHGMVKERDVASAGNGGSVKITD